VVSLDRFGRSLSQAGGAVCIRPVALE